MRSVASLTVAGLIGASACTGFTAAPPSTTTPTCAVATTQRSVEPYAAPYVPSVSASYFRFFADTASWNRPVAGLGRSTLLESYADRLWLYGGGDACPGATHVSFRNDSVPMYDRSLATTTARVFQDPDYQSRATIGNVAIGTSIPWNPSWEPSPGFDRTLTIVDYATGLVWELWVVFPGNDRCGLSIENVSAGFDTSNSLHLCIGGIRTYSNLRTATDDGTIGIRGAGLKKLALTVRADEVLSGTIKHALPLTVANPMFGPLASPADAPTGAGAGTTKGFYLKSATRLEHADPATLALGGVTTAPVTDEQRAKTVPSGMRFAIDITDTEINDWLDSRGFVGAKRATARTFAVALRDYGAIVAETGNYGIGIETDGLINPESAAEWAIAGISGGADNNFDAPGNLIDGLLTQDRLYVVNPPA